MSISALPSIQMNAPVNPGAFAVPNQNNNQNKIQLDLNYLQQCHVVFAIPMYGGQCFENIVTGLIKWAQIASEYKIDWSFMSLSNESLISRGRQTLTAKFLVDHPQATHLMWIDSDIGWEPEQVLLLLSHKVDIVGGLYPMKSLPLRWASNGLEGAVAQNGLEEVKTIGTGFLLIKRSVFDILKKHPKVINYKNDIGLDPKYDLELYTFFDTEVRDDRYLSEDWFFCMCARDMGLRVYADKRVLLRHSGYYVYNKQEEDLLYKIYGMKFIEQVCQQYNLRLVDAAGKSVNLQF